MRGKQAGVGGRRSEANRKLADSPLKSPRQSVLPPSLGPSVNEPIRRPLKLLTEPSTIEVLAFDAEGVPLRIRVERRTDQVVRYWGPERIETGWWDGPQVRRDYYRVELASGQWWWIFHQLDRVAARVWKLHGVFS
jgi:protein ImuB